MNARVVERKTKNGTKRQETNWFNTKRKQWPYIYCQFNGNKITNKMNQKKRSERKKNEANRQSGSVSVSFLRIHIHLYRIHTCIREPGEQQQQHSSTEHTVTQCL